MPVIGPGRRPGATRSLWSSPREPTSSTNTRSATAFGMRAQVRRQLQLARADRASPRHRARRRGGNLGKRQRGADPLRGPGPRKHARGAITCRSSSIRLAGRESIPMWSLGNNRWVYKLFGPFNVLDAFSTAFAGTISAAARTMPRRRDMTAGRTCHDDPYPAGPA